jgi:hypothetical protein
MGPPPEAARRLTHTWKAGTAHECHSPRFDGSRDAHCKSVPETSVAYAIAPDYPNIRLLRVTPVDAQYWDAPGATVAYVKMVTAALTGSRPSMGENRKVKM